METRASKRAYWARMVALHGRSGLSKAAFARREGLDLKLLYRWATQLNAQPEGAMRLLPVAVAQQPARAHVVVDVRTLQINVPADADPEAVARLVTALRASAC